MNSIYLVIVFLIVIILFLAKREYDDYRKKQQKNQYKNFCPKCGTPLTDIKEYCPVCGYHLNAKEEKKVIKPIIEDNGTEFFIPQNEAVTECLIDEDKPSLALRININSMISEVEITKFPCTIGRLEGECGLLIEESAVGRKHAILDYEDSKYWITDLNSNNGTYVNGVRIEKNKKINIKENDVLKIGRAVIHVLSDE